MRHGLLELNEFEPGLCYVSPQHTAGPLKAAQGHPEHLNLESIRQEFKRFSSSGYSEAVPLQDSAFTPNSKRADLLTDASLQGLNFLR